LVQENGEWRIQYMVDEGTEALNLPTEELYQKIREHTEPINEITRRHGPTDADAAKYAVELLRNLFQSTNYIDALLARSYDDHALYREAAKRMQLFGFGERSLVYLEQLTQRFEEDRASDLRTMATIQLELSKQFEDEGDDERAQRFLELAEEALRESMALEDRFETHITLAEVLISGEEKLEEAEDHLLRAKAMIASTDTAEEAHIEMHLGEIAMEQKRNEDALIHYRRVTELAPDHVDSWADLGNIYDQLGNLEEAEASFRKAIAIDPSNEDLYFVLSQIFYRHDKLDEAIAIMGEGLSANPDSAILNVYLASMFIESGDYRQADIFLNKAERLDPDLEMVQMFRQVLNELKKVRPAPISFKPGKPKKKHR
jgi:tetratricopeptide (TPR) repeat protein